MSKYLTTAIMLSLAGALCVTGCSKRGPKPASGDRNFDQVAQAVARRNDRVSADELAGWIIQGKKDFVLIDVRSPTDYANGHIDGARNLPVPELISPEQMKTLPKDRRVIVYSQVSETAAQAAVLLRLAGYHADLLLGGYNFWTQHVLNPNIPAAQADEESQSGAERQAIACYFVGGNKLAQAAPPPPPPPKPAFVPPVSTPSAPPLVYPAHNEGC